MTTVLIVEDDPVNLRVFTKILKKRGGFEVKGTENVDEVMNLSYSGKIDIILMDVSFGNSYYQGEAVDGIRITQILKADTKTNHIPIILVTAHAMQGDKESFLSQSGANGYICKPVIDHQGFVDTVNGAVNK